jgi:protein-S-isoprenylcysteine O-methyltransferase Ste14
MKLWHDKSLWGKYIVPKLKKHGWNDRSIQKLNTIQLALSVALIIIGVLLILL